MRIYSYDEYKEAFIKHGILVTAKHQVARILEENSANDLMMSFDTWFLIKNSEEYKKIEFIDKKSYKVLDAIQNSMLNSTTDNLLPYVTSNQYFDVGPFENGIGEVFVDCGAYVGDTVEKFIQRQCGNFKKIYAFEPGTKQYEAMALRTKRLINEWGLLEDKIDTINAGIGSITGFCGFNEMNFNTSLQLHQGGDSIRVYRLDDYCDGEVTWIKSDIEGMEMEMLNGAKEIIKKYRPKFTISVYHKPDDLFRIYDYLRVMHSDYRFALRQHSAKLIETVLYVW